MSGGIYGRITNSIEGNMIHKRQRVSEAKRSGGLISTRACRRNRWHETGLLMDGANRRNCWREMGLLMDGANRRGFRQARWLMALMVLVTPFVLVTPLVLVAQPGLATGPGPVVHGEVAPIEATPIEGLTVELFPGEVVLASTPRQSVSKPTSYARAGAGGIESEGLSLAPGVSVERAPRGGLSFGMGSEDAVRDHLLQGYLDRQLQMRRNKHILLGWGAANVASGLALYATDYRDFGVMNASWGAINAGIALLAMRGATDPDTAPSYADMLREEQQFNRIVALNTGLDVGYMIAGLWMMTDGRDSMVRQYGTSIVVQGAFLFAYDLWLTVESTRYLNRLTIAPTLNGVSVRLSW